MDLIIGELRDPVKTVEVCTLNYKSAENHRWYYYPAMSKFESLIFKCFDSEVSYAQ